MGALRHGYDAWQVGCGPKRTHGIVRGEHTWDAWLESINIWAEEVNVTQETENNSYQNKTRLGNEG